MMQRKRLLAILLCLAMCASLFPAQVLAEAPEESEEDMAEVSLTDDIYEEEPESLFSFPEEMDEPVPEEETALPESEMLPEADEPDAETPEDSELVTEDPGAPVNTDEDGKEEPDPETADEAQEPEEVLEDEPTEEQEEEPTEEPIDEEPVPVQVHFILNPEDAQLTVYERIEEEILELQPEEDGSWLLLPGEYYYSASADGYETVEETSFTVSSDVPSVGITVNLVSYEDDAPVETMGTSGTCGKNGNNLSWTLDDSGVLTISGTGEMYDYSYALTSSAPGWYNNQNSIKSLIVEDGVTSIGKWAFFRCGSLKSVTLADSVEKIGYHSFEECKELASIDLPTGLKTIEAGAFRFCESLETLELPEGLTTIGIDAFHNCTGLARLVIPGSVTVCDDQALSGCSGLKTAGPLGGGYNVEFGWTDSIPANAFRGLQSLETVVLPAGLRTIESGAFGYCSALKTVKIPEGLITIAEYAFYYCEALSEITLPISLTTVKSDAFSGCYNLKTVYYDGFYDQQQALANQNAVLKAATWIKRLGYGTLGNLNWVLYNNGNLIISGHGDMPNFTSAEAVPWYTNRGSVHSTVIVEDGVTSIGDYAFSGCSMSRVTIPEGVSRIGAYAFQNCSRLTEITLPASLKSIGLDAFSGCSCLAHIYYPDIEENWERITGNGNIPEAVKLIFKFSGTSDDGLYWSLAENGKLTISGTGNMADYSNRNRPPWYQYAVQITALIVKSGVTGIGSYAFSGCSSMTNVMIPESVTNIGNYAFSDCSVLASVIIPESITNIGNNAFSGCSSLTRLTIPGSVTNVGDYAFSGCTGLTNVTIPESVTNIGYNAFSGCSSLDRVDIHDIAAWCAIAFGNNYANPLYSAHNLYVNGMEIKDLVIPSDVVKIGSYAFCGCSSLTSVTVPDSVVNIGHSVFNDCSNLTNAGPINSGCSIEYGWTKQIPANAFRNCSSLTSVIILDGITSIGDSAFSSCINLTSVAIPESVTSIGNDSFSGCSSMLSVTLPESLIRIGEYAFSFCPSLARVTIPAGVDKILRGSFSNCSGLTSVTIPESVTSIGYYAFQNCYNLTSVTIPESVTSIGYYAFQDCSNLTSAGPVGSGCSIEYGWTEKIPAEAFQNIRSLTSVTFPNSLTSIGSSAFNGDSALTEVVIPNQVTSIENYAFYNCSCLTSVTIPFGMGSIGNGAFAYCNALTDVYYGGREYQWNVVLGNIGSNNEKLIGATIHFMGTITASGNCGADGNNLTWTLDNNGVFVISGSGMMADMSSNAPWYDVRTQIRKVEIGNSVASIGNGAFCDCVNLTDITIPESVISIGSRAFSNCDKLSNITLPSALTVIAEGVFSDCSSLKSVTIPLTVTEIGDDAFLHCNGLNEVYFEGTRTLWAELQINIGNNNERLTEAFIICQGSLLAYGLCGAQGDNVKWILDYQGLLTIYGDGEMADFTSSGNLPWVGNKGDVASIEIKRGVTSIGSDAFYGCSGLTSVTIPDSVTSIGSDAFYGCSGLTSLNIHDLASWCGISFASTDANPIHALYYYGDNNKLYVDGTELRDLVVPDSVTGIGSYVFYGCSSLTSVTIPDSVTSIGYCAFSRCWGLTSVTIPDSVTSIGDGAFSDCWGLTSVTIPDSVTIIGASTFDYTNLTSVTIPDSVTSIGEYAFDNCRAITEIIMKGDMPGIASTAFNEVTATVFYPPGNATYTVEKMLDYGGNLTWEALASGICGVNLTWTLDDDGMLTVSGTGRMDDYSPVSPAPWGTCICTVIIEDGVTSIGSYAFDGCSKLSGVSIPSTLEEIGENAFRGCTSLADVSYGSDADHWEAIQQESGNDLLAAAQISFPAHTHNWSEWTVVKEATCTESGTEQRVCAFCRTIEIRQTQAVGHMGGEAVRENEVASSCTEEGSYDEVVYCTVCHAELSRVEKPSEKIAHTAGAAVHENIVDSTCTAEGSYDEVVYCAVCHEELTRTKKNTEKLEHTAGQAVHENEIEATCTMSGKYDEVVYCTACSKELSRTKKTVEPSGHKEGTPLRENEIVATYTSEGSYDEVVYCTTCGIVVRREHKIVGKLDHTHQPALQYAREATCTEDGYTGDKICTLCNELIESGEVIPALGHKTELRNVIAPTCSQTGYTGDEVCTVCGETVKTGTVIAKLAHTPGEAVRENVFPSTCTVEGSYDEVVYCTECHEDLRRVEKPIEKLPHTPGEAVLENVVASTCTVEGSYDEVVYCTECHTQLSREKKSIEKLPHTPGEAVRENVVPSTCTAEGSYDEVVYCTECHTELSRVEKAIEKLPHTPGDAVRENIVASTCTAEGSYDEVVFCTECHEELSRVKKPTEKLPHTPGNAVQENIVDPTCTEEGSYDEVVYCTECHTELSRVKKSIEKLPHTPGETVRENIVDPTCTVEGSYDEVVYCTECHTELSRESFIIEKLPHTPQLVNVKEPTETEFGYTGDTVCSECGEVLSHGEPIPMLEPDWSGLPAELQLNRGYLLLKMDTGAVTLDTNLTDPAYIVRLDWTTESGTEDVVSVSNGTVTAKAPGTDYVVAEISNAEKTLTARCRIDVLDEEKQADREIQVVVPEKQLSTELFKTDYTRFQVVLRLEQNVKAADVTLADDTTLEDTGVMITGAEFVGGGKQNILDVFGLRIVDDRSLEIIPIIDLDNAAAVKKVASSYKSAVRLTLSNGQELTTPELTVKVKKTLPKLKAAKIQLNRFIDGATAQIVITGGTVRSFTANTLDFAVLDDDLTVRLKEGVAKNVSGKYTLNCELKDWAKPAKVTVQVSVGYTAPKTTLNPTSVTLNPDPAERAETAVKLVPLPGMSHRITVEAVSGLSTSYNEATQKIEVQVGNAVAGTYKVPVKADGKQVAVLTVKVLPKKSPATLTAKVSGTIDTAVDKSPVVISVSGKNCHIGEEDYSVQILQTNKKLDIIDQPATSLFHVVCEGSTVTITGKDSLKDYVTGYTYSAMISADSIGAKPAVVKFSVKSSPKAPAATVTLKAAGSIDVLRPGSHVVITPTFKNWYGYDLSQAKLNLNTRLFEYDLVDGKFVVRPVYGADIDPKAAYTVTLTLDGYTTRAVKLPVKMGAVKIEQSVKALTLMKNDRFDRQSVKLILNDDTLYDIDGARVELDAKSKARYSLTRLGSGEYAIGYKDNTLPDIVTGSSVSGAAAILDGTIQGNGGGGVTNPTGPVSFDGGKPKSDTVKLNVFLDGNGGTAPNKVITIKLKLA